MHVSTQLHRYSSRHVTKRAGTILVITAIVLIAMFGLLGLIIDAGLLMTAHREAQNAADAGATAAAMDMMNGKPHATAIATANLFVKDYNGLTNATATTLIPPDSGPHAGNSRFAQVNVSYSVPMRFIQILGVGTTQSVSARAVAGYEGSSNAATVILLDAAARPGFYADGSAFLKVNGNVAINSNGGGNKETGQPINNGNSGSAIELIGDTRLFANSVLSVGGLTWSGSSAVKHYNTALKGSPLITGVTPTVDPLQNLPTPTTANGAVGTAYPAVYLNGVQNVTLSPGVYPSITLEASAKAFLNPGIYIIKGGNLHMNGDTRITGSGVMFYLTGSDYNVNTGLPDSGDINTPPPAAGGATFGGLLLEGSSSINVTPLSDLGSPFDGMGFYQRRINPKPFRQLGYTPIASFRGTIYAKSAQVQLEGSRTFSAQFIVASVRLTGGTSITVDATSQNVTKVNQVFLVE